MIKNRIIWLDLAKLFAIFLVVLGHCYQQFDIQYKNSPVFLAIYAFHMPLFMMISGYFLDFHKIMNKGNELIWKRILQLIFPSLIWLTIIWIIKYIIGISLLTYSRTLWFGLWFLKSLFTCNLLLIISVTLFKNKLLAFGISLLLSQLTVFVPHMWFLQLYIMYPSLLCGIMVNEIFSRSTKQTAVITIFATIAFGLQLPFLDKTHIFPDMYLMLSSQWIDQYVVLLYKLAIGIIGAISVIGIFKLIFEQIESLKWDKISNLGKLTLEIYILQTLLLELLLSNYVHISSTSFGPYIHLIYPILAIVIILCCIGLARVLNICRLSWMFNFNEIKSICQKFQ